MINVETAILNNLDRLASKAVDSIREESERRVKMAAIGIHSNVVKAIQEQSSGKTEKRYHRGRQGKMVLTSKPGDAPNVDTGNLIRSYKWQFDKVDMEAVVGSGVPYSKHLEFGTKHIKARPHLRPAFDKYFEETKNHGFKLKGVGGKSRTA